MLTSMPAVVWHDAVTVASPSDLPRPRALGRYLPPTVVGSGSRIVRPFDVAVLQTFHRRPHTYHMVTKTQSRYQKYTELEQ